MPTLLQVKVDAICDEASDIRSFELVDPDRKHLPEFEPGAHIDIHLSPTVIRQYSLCGDADDPSRYVIAVKREADSRGGSQAIHTQIQKGDLLWIGAPRNNFPLATMGRHHVLLAGGIGVTPLLSMARRLAKTGQSFELHYFTRSQENTAFRETLLGNAFARNVHFNHGLDAGAVSARVTSLFKEPSPQTHVYLCGPRPFMDLIRPIALNTLPPENLHVEYFAADETVRAGADETLFTVRLARSGREIEVSAGQSIVQALAERGIEVETYCQQGLCGTCMTKILEGIPDHRDGILPDDAKQAGNVMMICVSRSLTPLLVLDL